MFAFILMIIFKKKDFNFGNKYVLIVLSLFSICWIYFSDGHEISGICLPICYLLGCNIKSGEENNINKFIYLVTFSMATYTILFFINNAITNGITSYDINNQTNIWTNKPLWPTNIMLYSSLFMSLFGYILFVEKKKYIKVLYFIMFSIIAFYALMLSRRAALLMVIISLFITFVGMLIIGDDKKKIISLFVIASIIFLVVIALLVTFYLTNFLGFKDIVVETDLYKRFIAPTEFLFFNDMGRSQIRKDFLSHFWEYPWGGSNIHNIIGNWAHDLWLDVYDVAGILAFILMIIYTLLFFYDFIKIIINKNNNNSIKILLLGMSLCILAQLNLEPILEACRNYMFALCMIHGSLYTLKDNKNV